jgi:beta-phosphoglucomutase-like phosphatase (HAD superfamily)
MPAHDAAARVGTSRGLGLPARTRAGLFDLDGVLTRTTDTHLAAWRQVFDEFLAGTNSDAGRPFSDQGHLEYVDGKPRRDGVGDFLASRGIQLPEGDPDERPSSRTIAGIANTKQERLVKLLGVDRVQVYAGSADYVRAARAAGVAAGRAGGFGYVVGIDRVGQAEALRRHGADIVVADLAELMDA